MFMKLGNTFACRQNPLERYYDNFLNKYTFYVGKWRIVVLKIRLFLPEGREKRNERPWRDGYGMQTIPLPTLNSTTATMFVFKNKESVLVLRKVLKCFKFIYFNWIHGGGGETRIPNILYA